MKIDIIEGENKIRVIATAQSIHRRKYNVKEKIKTEDILQHLSQTGVKVGKCIHNGGHATNMTDAESLTAEWIFLKPREIKKTNSPRSTSSSRKKSQKSKKTLDKTTQRVIIDKE